MPSIPASAVPAVLAVFFLTYVGIAAGRVPGLKLNRTGIVLLGAIAIALVSRLPTTTVAGFVNWPTLLLLFGFFVLSAQLRLSGFFDVIAQAVANRLGRPARFLLILMLVTAGLSAFLNHDVVCLVFAPVVATALVARRLNPVPFLVALAVASNIGAAATPVGNPQDMFLAQLAGLNFGRYIAWCLGPVLFALGAAYAIIWSLSRRQLAGNTDPAARVETISRPFDRAHTIKGLVILGLVVAFFFTAVPKEVIALTAAGIHLASPKFTTEALLGLVDWSLLVLFMGLFVVTGVFEATGSGEQAVQWLAHGGLTLGSPSVLAVVTATLSNLIGNSASVLLLAKMVDLTHPPTAYVLALANSFGGSLIILGSVSNLIVVQQARDLGIAISFRDFARLGVPVTIAAMAGLLGWVALLG